MRAKESRDCVRCPHETGQDRHETLAYNIMYDFLRFLWHCAHKGWEFGEGSFSPIETICTLLALGLFTFKKAKPKKWKHWEENIMRMAFWVFVSSFLLTTFLV